MKLAYAFLADAASVENGKVYVLGGGVNVLWRPSFPAPVAATVVVSFAYNNVEIGQERKLTMQINDEDGQPIAPPLEGSFVLPPRAPNVPGTVPLASVFAINIAPNIPIIPAPGNYVIELSADNNHVESIPFAAILHAPGEAAEEPASDEADT